MLLAVRNFIQEQGVVSSEQLSREFCIALDALKPMLEICIHKGFIRSVNSKKACGSPCQSCPTQRIDYYEWISC
ncbi:MAG: FeoC-like transcriptional regulator [Gammaproteobacteria bacterium]